MKRLLMARTGLLLIPALAVLLGSCSVKHVTSFTKTSLSALEQCSAANPFSFVTYCEKCQSKPLKKLVDLNTGELSPLNCTLFERADSARDIFDKVLKGYLLGLSRLSEGNTEEIDVGDLAGKLDGIKDNLPEKMQLNSAQVKSANILSKAFNEGVQLFLKHKLKKIIIRSDTHFNITLRYYSKLLGDLESNDSLCIENYREFVTAAVMDSSKDVGTRMLAIKDFRSFKAEYSSYIELFEKQKRLLEKIGAGHQLCALNPLSSSATKKELKKITKSISALGDECLKLKHH